jgi:hypothetical protein
MEEYTLGSLLDHLENVPPGGHLRLGKLLFAEKEEEAN